MKIRVKFIGPFFYLTNCKEITLDIPHKSTVNELLMMLAIRFGDDFNKKVTKEALNNKALQKLIYVNNYSIFYLKKLETELKENDVISFFPPMAGG
jgi:MoaD family protein